MKKCFIFPWQGAQKVGMGSRFYEESESARRIWEEAEEIMGAGLKDKIFNGPEEELKKTEITQPAVYITEIVILEELLKRGIKAEAAAGHSLGEYAAAAASGAMSWQTGLELVKKRGEIFQKASTENPGGMIAAVGIGEEELREILEKFEGVACIVNYNCPGQLVISADKENIPAVLDKVGRKAKMAVELKVSGGFHSPLMDRAAEEMAEYINSAEIFAPRIGFYVNFSGSAAGDAEAVREALIKQVNSPVLWTDIIENIKKDLNAVDFYEVGPGRVLKGLMRRIDRGLKVKNISAPGDLKKD